MIGAERRNFWGYKQGGFPPKSTFWSIFVHRALILRSVRRRSQKKSRTPTFFSGDTALTTNSVFYKTLNVGPGATNCKMQIWRQKRKMMILTPSPSGRFWRALVLCLLWRCLLGPLNVTQKSPVLSKSQVPIFELFWETHNVTLGDL